MQKYLRRSFPSGESSDTTLGLDEEKVKIQKLANQHEIVPDSPCPGATLAFFCYSLMQETNRTPSVLV